MSNIQHKDIPDAQRHEPKGASTATSKTAYWSDGAGSGAWEKLDATKIQGISSDGGLSGYKLLTNGSNGFALFRDSAYGVMATTGNTNNFALTAVADTTFNTASQFVLFTGTGAPWASETLSGVTFTTDRLTVPVAGIYEVNVFANVLTYPSSSALVALRIMQNATTYLGRKIVSKSAAASDANNMSGNFLITLAASDYIQLMIASNATGNAVLTEASVSIKLIKAT